MVMSASSRKVISAGDAKDADDAHKEPFVPSAFASPKLNHAPHRRDDVVDGKAEVLEQDARWSGLAEGIDADHRAVESDVLAPIVGHPGLDRDARHSARKHAVAEVAILAVEKARARHRHHPHR